jgi:hypothetical protein
MPFLQGDWRRGGNAADAPRRAYLSATVHGVSGEGQDRQLRRPYFFASPSNLPVFRSMKCSLVQAGQTIPSYSFSEISGSPIGAGR